MNKSIVGKANIMAHVITWAIIYLLPTIVTICMFKMTVPMFAHLRYGIFVTFHLLAIFYLNYCLLIERYLLKSKMGLFLVFNLLAFIFVEIISNVLTTTIASPPDIDLNMANIMHSRPVHAGAMTGGLMSMVFAVLVAISLKTTRQIRLDEEKRQTLEKEKTEAELKNLKNKLNPHFLFNSLNNIYALTSFDPEKAQEAINSLSKLLRYVLYENDSDMVPLAGELEFTRCYIDLMALRLDPSRTSLAVNIQEKPDGNYLVATLMFMTLIENAFKHGVSTREKSFINISISFTDGTVDCLVENSMFPKTENDKSGSGIGLQNLEQRLEILYSGQYTYEVNTEDDKYSAHLTFPLKTVQN